MNDKFWEDCLSLPSLGWKFFNTERDIKLKGNGDEIICLHTKKFIRHFIQKSIENAPGEPFREIF